MVWETIAEQGLIAAIKALRGVQRARFLKCAVVARDVDMRVAFSALLQLRRGGQYIMVRNLHRPETFGPFGGVYKYRDAGKHALDEMQFKPQDLGPGEDMRDDLRGFLPRKNVAKIYKWFHKGRGRETEGACLQRELQEELEQAGVTTDLELPSLLSLRHVRTVYEGPEPVPGQRYTQFRQFDVYEPTADDNSVELFLTGMLELAPTNDDLLVASADEIQAGRARDNNIIGHHAVYLVGGTRIRGEDPPFAYENHSR